MWKSRICGLDTWFLANVWKWEVGDRVDRGQVLEQVLESAWDLADSVTLQLKGQESSSCSDSTNNDIC